VQAKQKKEFIHYTPSAGRCSAVSRKAGLHHVQWLLQKTNTVTLKTPSFLLPQFYIAEHDVIRYGISLWSARVSCPSCVPSQVLVHPQPTRWWGGARSRRDLGSVQALLSNNENIPVLSALLSAQIQNIAPC